MLKSKNIVSYNCNSDSSRILYIKEICNNLRKCPEVKNVFMFSVSGNEDASTYYIFFDTVADIAINNVLDCGKYILTDISKIDQRNAGITKAFQDCKLDVNDLVRSDVTLTTLDTETNIISVSESGASVRNEQSGLILSDMYSFSRGVLEGLMTKADEGVYIQDILKGLYDKKDKLPTDSEEYEKIYRRILALKAVKSSLQLDYIDKSATSMLLNLACGQLTHS